MYFEYYLMGIIILPGIIFAIWAQSRVSGAYSNYSKVIGAKGLTGAQVAEKILHANGIYDVEIRQISGELSDNYNPRTKVISLSHQVYTGTTIADLGVAAHECGHAVQHAKNYAPLKIRSVLAVASNISSHLLWPLVFVGLILGFAVESQAGTIVLWAGVIFFGLSLLFSLITLPVELNASKRALKSLVEVDALDSMEVVGAKSVLNAAALTYVAATVVALLELLRFVLVFARRDD